MHFETQGSFETCRGDSGPYLSPEDDHSDAKDTHGGEADGEAHSQGHHEVHLGQVVECVVGVERAHDHTRKELQHELVHEFLETMEAKG